MRIDLPITCSMTGAMLQYVLYKHILIVKVFARAIIYPSVRKAFIKNDRYSPVISYSGI